jgi:hypothetical protein
MAGDPVLGSLKVYDEVYNGIAVILGFELTVRLPVQRSYPVIP